MSTTNNYGDMTCYAACGRGRDGLRTCTACKTVKYCSVQCQKDHCPKHKKECKKRATELFDEKLFQDPPQREECPVRFISMPIDAEQVVNQFCCGKLICRGCTFAAENKEGWMLCPFCRQEPTEQGDFEERLRRLGKCMDANDPEAFFMLGCYY